MKISAAIITLNEEANLARCLESVRDVADEMVVVDAGSTDRTQDIAEQHGARVFVREWRSYSDQKNYAAGLADFDWILSLDADECLSPLLRQRLLDLKVSQPQFQAYAFPRLARYLGRWIRHSGWYPDRKVRLYDRTRAQWVGDFVHESLKVDGTVGTVEADLLHYTCNSISEHAERLDRYTTLAANELRARGKHAGMTSMLGASLAAFVKSYCLKLGFRDGRQGCLIAAFAAYYNFLKYAKLWELEHAPADETD
ncbi:MAG: glycosyltransferase family 2 protein [Acidobacteriota bacterium]